MVVRDYGYSCRYEILSVDWQQCWDHCYIHQVAAPCKASFDLCGT